MSIVRSAWLLAAVLSVAASTQEFALNPQPLPPSKLPPVLFQSKVQNHGVIVPPQCHGPAKTCK
jgi:hypothetical protein